MVTGAAAFWYKNSNGSSEIPDEEKENAEKIEKTDMS